MILIYASKKTKKFGWTDTKQRIFKVKVGLE